MQRWNSGPWVHFSGCETNWGRRKGVEVMTETKSYGNDSLKPISFYYFWLAVCIHVKTVYAQVNPDMKWFVCVDTRRRSLILSRSMLRVLMMLVRYVFLPGLIHSYHKIFVWHMITFDYLMCIQAFQIVLFYWLCRWETIHLGYFLSETTFISIVCQWWSPYYQWKYSNAWILTICCIVTYPIQRFLGISNWVIPNVIFLLFHLR